MGTILMVIGKGRTAEKRSYSDDRIGKEFLRQDFFAILNFEYMNNFSNKVSTEKNAENFIRIVEYPCINDHPIVPKIFSQGSVYKDCELSGLEDDLWSEFKRMIL